MPLDLGTGLKLFDYAVKYRKQISRGWDFLFRREPIKLNLEVPPPKPSVLHARHTSDFIALTILDQGKIVYISSASVGWNDQIVTLEFRVDAETDAILGRIGRNDQVLVAHWYKAVRCKCTHKERYVSGHKTWFKFNLDIMQSDFTIGIIEHASQPEHFRERARRVLFQGTADLLPEVPESFGKDNRTTVAYLNTIFREIQVEGTTGVVESPLPELYARFGEDPDRFLQIAWIQLAMDLQVTGVVTEIQLMELELEGSRLYINLRARRHDNDMSVEGYCEFPGSTVRSAPNWRL